MNNCPCFEQKPDEYSIAMKRVKLQESNKPVKYCVNCGDKLHALQSDFCDAVCASEYFNGKGGF